MWIVILAVAVTTVIARDRWLDHEARAALLRWAAEHSYVLVRCRRRWLPPLFLNVTPHSYEHGREAPRHAYTFAITVRDRSAGTMLTGTASVGGNWLRGVDSDLGVEWDYRSP